MTSPVALIDADLTLRSFFDAWEFYRMPALTGAAAGGLLGVLGVYVVLRRLVFLSAAVSQAAGLGVALAFLLQAQLGLSASVASPTLGAAIFTIAVTFLVASDRGGGTLRRDSLLGFAYLVGAAGMLAVAKHIRQELHDISSLLFGSAVAVLPDDFHVVVWMTAVLLVVHLLGWRGFGAVSFDKAGAKVRGMPVRLLEIVLFVTLALAISVATRVIGALPTFAFSVLPAMAAVRVSPNVQVSLVVAGLVGAATGFAGYLAAYMWRLPVGTSQTLIASGVVVVVEVAWWITRLARRGSTRATA